MPRTLPLLLLVLTAAACSEERRSPPPTKAVRPVLTHATQVDLARELEAAERDGTWIGVRRRWQGQPVRWTVTRQRALCRSSESCNVAAFPIQRPARQGWMPELVFAPGQFEVLEAQCGAAAQCDVMIEGVLERLEASDELPTSVRIAGVTIVGPRTAGR